MGLDIRSPPFVVEPRPKHLSPTAIYVKRHGKANQRCFAAGGSSDAAAPGERASPVSPFYFRVRSAGCGPLRAHPGARRLEQIHGGLQIVAGRLDQTVEPPALLVKDRDLRFELADPRLPVVPLGQGFGERALDLLALGDKAGEFRARRFDVSLDLLERAVPSSKLLVKRRQPSLAFALLGVNRLDFRPGAFALRLAVWMRSSSPGARSTFWRSRKSRSSRPLSK